MSFSGWIGRHGISSSEAATADSTVLDGSLVSGVRTPNPKGVVGLSGREDGTISASRPVRASPNSGYLDSSSFLDAIRHADGFQSTPQADHDRRVSWAASLETTHTISPRMTQVAAPAPPPRRVDAKYMPDEALARYARLDAPPLPAEIPCTDPDSTKTPRRRSYGPPPPKEHPAAHRGVRWKRKSGVVGSLEESSRSKVVRERDESAGSGVLLGREEWKEEDETKKAMATLRTYASYRPMYKARPVVGRVASPSSPSSTEANGDEGVVSSSEGVSPAGKDKVLRSKQSPVRTPNPGTLDASSLEYDKASFVEDGGEVEEEEEDDDDAVSRALWRAKERLKRKESRKRVDGGNEMVWENERVDPAEELRSTMARLRERQEAQRRKSGVGKDNKEEKEEKKVDFEMLPNRHSRSKVAEISEREQSIRLLAAKARQRAATPAEIVAIDAAERAALQRADPRAEGVPSGDLAVREAVRTVEALRRGEERRLGETVIRFEEDVVIDVGDEVDDDDDGRAVQTRSMGPETWLETAAMRPEERRRRRRRTVAAVAAATASTDQNARRSLQRANRKAMVDAVGTPRWRSGGGGSSLDQGYATTSKYSTTNTSKYTSKYSSKHPRSQVVRNLSDRSKRRKSKPSDVSQRPPSYPPGIAGTVAMLTERQRRNQTAKLGRSRPPTLTHAPPGLFASTLQAFAVDSLPSSPSVTDMDARSRRSSSTTSLPSLDQLPDLVFRQPDLDASFFERYWKRADITGVDPETARTLASTNPNNIHPPRKSSSASVGSSTASNILPDTLDTLAESASFRVQTTAEDQDTDIDAVASVHKSTSLQSDSNRNNNAPQNRPISPNDDQELWAKPRPDLSMDSTDLLQFAEPFPLDDLGEEDFEVEALHPEEPPLRDEMFSGVDGQEEKDVFREGTEPEPEKDVFRGGTEPEPEKDVYRGGTEPEPEPEKDKEKKDDFEGVKMWSGPLLRLGSKSGIAESNVRARAELLSRPGMDRKMPSRTQSMRVESPSKKKQEAQVALPESEEAPPASALLRRAASDRQLGRQPPQKIVQQPPQKIVQQPPPPKIIQQQPPTEDKSRPSLSLARRSRSLSTSSSKSSASKSNSVSNPKRVFPLDNRKPPLRTLSSAQVAVKDKKSTLERSSTMAPPSSSKPRLLASDALATKEPVSALFQRHNSKKQSESALPPPPVPASSRSLVALAQQSEETARSALLQRASVPASRAFPPSEESSADEHSVGPWEANEPPPSGPESNPKPTKKKSTKKKATTKKSKTTTAKPKRKKTKKRTN